jgi:hypothetical protein
MRGDQRATAGAISDLVLAAKIVKGDWSPTAIESLRGQSFAEGEPPRIKALHKLNPSEFDEFINWARWNSQIVRQENEALNAMERAGNFETHRNIGIDIY